MKTSNVSGHFGNLHNNQHVEGAYFVNVAINSETHGEYELEGRILSESSNIKPRVIYIHGARADYTKADKFLVPVYQKGLSLLGATVSGHGHTGHVSQEPFSLDDNLKEAEAFSRLLDVSQPCTAIGFSMGGATAIRLVQKHPEIFNRLVLFYPAIFPDESYAIPFGTVKFREIASRLDSYLGSSLFETIKTFDGKIMLIKGEYDGIDPASVGLKDANAVGTVFLDGQERYSPIPPKVFTKILEVRPDTKYIAVKGVDHLFAKWAETHSSEAQNIGNQVANFILN